LLYAADYAPRRRIADVALVIMHANWVLGPAAKRQKLQEDGAWKVKRTEASCVA
jgi:hypothetical protein